MTALRSFEEARSALETALVRIDAYNPMTNAVVLRTDEVVRAASARGFPELPLAGLGFSLIE